MNRKQVNVRLRADVLPLQFGVCGKLAIWPEVLHHSFGAVHPQHRVPG